MFQAICLHVLSQLYYRHDASHYILQYVSTGSLQKIAPLCRQHSIGWAEKEQDHTKFLQLLKVFLDAP